MQDLSTLDRIPSGPGSGCSLQMRLPFHHSLFHAHHIIDLGGVVAAVFLTPSLLHSANLLSPWPWEALDIHPLNYSNLMLPMGLPRWLSGKESACQCRRRRRLRFNPWVRKIPRRRKMATHSSILAWEILWTEEPGGLQSIGSQRGRHN